MKEKRLLRLITLGYLTLLLSACGFHLRESVLLPENLQATAVQGVSEYSNLDLSLKRAFRQAGYPLTTPSNASAILVVTKNAVSRRVLSVNAAGVANEYELKYTLQLKLLDTDQKELVPPQTITVYRSYHYDPDIVLSKAAEEERLQKDMTDYAVKQLIRRISAKRQSSGQSDATPATLNK